MTKEELKTHCERQVTACEMWAKHTGEKIDSKLYEEHKLILELLDKASALDKIREEVENKIEQEEFARDVFRGEEKDTVKAEQCTGSIFAYRNVIRLIDKYKAEKDEADV